jgi:hypothetical protein
MFDNMWVVSHVVMWLRRRYVGAKEHDVEPPPVVMTALTWGLFMGVSSNLRYQVNITINHIAL